MLSSISARIACGYRRGRSPLALPPCEVESSSFCLPLWLAGRQGAGSISLREISTLKPLTAAILPVLRLRRQREADVPSAPRWRFAIVRAKPPPLHGSSWQAMQGVPPCTPRRSKKLMWLRRKERERNQAPILGGGDLPARANTTAWGLME